MMINSGYKIFVFIIYFCVVLKVDEEVSEWNSKAKK